MNYGNNTATSIAATAEQPRSIPNAVSNLQSAVDRLQGAVSRQHKRLCAIAPGGSLVTDIKTGETMSAPKPLRSPVADQIYTAAELLERLALEVERVTDSIEV